METLVIDVMAKKRDFTLKERTFLQFNVELVLPEQGEDRLKVLEVVFNGFAEDMDVIQVDNHEGIKVWVEHIVHSSLESSWSICHTKWHNKPLILARPGDEC